MPCHHCKCLQSKRMPNVACNHQSRQHSLPPSAHHTTLRLQDCAWVESQYPYPSCIRVWRDDLISSLGRAKCKSLGTVRDNFRSRGSSFRRNGTKEKEVRPLSCVKSHIVHLATTLSCVIHPLLLLWWDFSSVEHSTCTCPSSLPAFPSPARLTALWIATWTWCRAA